MNFRGTITTLTNSGRITGGNGRLWRGGGGAGVVERLDTIATLTNGGKISGGNGGSASGSGGFFGGAGGAGIVEFRNDRDA